MEVVKKPASLRNYKLSIPANSQETFQIQGTSVRLLNANVPISFVSEDGMLGFTLSNGDEAVFESAIFYRFRLFHNDASEQLIEISVGNGGRIGSAKLNGIVSVSGALALDAPTLAALENVDLNPATRDLLRFENYGLSYRSVTELASNVPEQIFAPASNVNGAIIHTMHFVSANAAAAALMADACFLAKSGAAPTTVLDGECILSADNYGATSTNNILGGSLKRPIRITAGKGLWFIQTAAEVGASRSCLYTLL